MNINLPVTKTGAPGHRRWFYRSRIGLSGARGSVLDVKLNNDDSYAVDGRLWIGQKNGNKDESSCIHLTRSSFWNEP